ncbi:30S ribosomal protein S2, partial [Candidatus Margulisiibacteriota bacterium]
LEHYLGGITDMTDLPKAVFIVDTHKEMIAVKEAIKLDIPIIGVVDTNCDPAGIKYPIPANDDAIRSIKLLCSIIANAALEGNQKLVSTAEEAKADEDIDIDIKEIEKNLEEKIEIEKDFSAEIIPEIPKEETTESPVEVAPIITGPITSTDDIELEAGNEDEDEEIEEVLVEEQADTKTNTEDASK